MVQYVERPRMEMFSRVMGEPRSRWLWPGTRATTQLLLDGVPLDWKRCRVCGCKELGFLMAMDRRQPRRSSIRIGPAMRAELRLLATCGHGTGWYTSMCAAMEKWGSLPVTVFNGRELAKSRHWGPL